MIKMPLNKHWRDLRLRLVICLVVYCLVLALCFGYADVIYAFFLEPLAQLMPPLAEQQRKLIFTSPSEAFFTYMRLAFFAGFILSFPVFSWQFYAFLAPGLYRREKRIFLLYLLGAHVLFGLAFVLVYFYVMPVIWQFFLSFEVSAGGNMPLPIMLEARVSEYLDLVLHLLFSFGVAFQLPIVLILLVHIGIVESAWLAVKRRHAIVLIFIVAALLTPPDVLTQITLALPLILLYEISVFICKIIRPQGHKHA